MPRAVTWRCGNQVDRYSDWEVAGSSTRQDCWMTVLEADSRAPSRSRRCLTWPVSSKPDGQLQGRSRGRWRRGIPRVAADHRFSSHLLGNASKQFLAADRAVSKDQQHHCPDCETDLDAERRAGCVRRERGQGARDGEVEKREGTSRSRSHWHLPLGAGGRGRAGSWIGKGRNCVCAR